MCPRVDIVGILALERTRSQARSFSNDSQMRKPKTTEPDAPPISIWPPILGKPGQSNRNDPRHLACVIQILTSFE